MQTLRLFACQHHRPVACLGVEGGLPYAVLDVTQTLLSHVSWIGPDGREALVPLLNRGLQHARAGGDTFALALTGLDEAALGDALEQAGFVPEIYRIGKDLALTPLAVSAPYRARRFREEDRSFVLHLAADALAQAAAVARGVPPDQMGRCLQERYAWLDMAGDGPCLGWIVESADSGTPCGFMTYDCSDAIPTYRGRTAYLIDIAIEPRQRGTGAGPYLMQCGEADLVRRGMRSVLAEVAIDNPPALVQATRLGYQIVGTQWLRRLDS